MRKGMGDLWSTGGGGSKWWPEFKQWWPRVETEY